MFGRTPANQGGLSNVTILRSFGLTLLVYVVLSYLFFGSIFGPLFALTFASDRLGAPLWPVLIVLSMACAAYAVSRMHPAEPLVYRPPVFVGVTMVLSIALVGAYAEWMRYRRVAEFKPDSYVSSSFFRSLREAPREFRFFLHATALKDCKPYAWSYREMDFYELPPRAAPNVLPDEWISRCDIKRPGE